MEGSMSAYYMKGISELQVFKVAIFLISYQSNCVARQSTKSHKLQNNHSIICNQESKLNKFVLLNSQLTRKQPNSLLHHQIIIPFHPNH